MSYLKRLGLQHPTYDTRPAISVPEAVAHECHSGWESIITELENRSGTASVLAVECYPGVDDDGLRVFLAKSLKPARTLDSKTAFKSETEIDAMVEPFLGGDDPVFGFLNQTLQVSDFFDASRLRELTRKLHNDKVQGLTLIVGPGASLIDPGADFLVYADMPRWEGQLRQRRGEADNLGTRNRGLKPSMQYKRSFFIDWRVADRLKVSTLSRWDYVLDSTDPAAPKLITGKAHLAALDSLIKRPFRLMPFFDPGPWGGQWIREVCHLPDGPPNYAWSFDGVPEENSLLLRFAGDVTVEIPSYNLVYRHPREFLGEPVYGRFGPEFPIRFDFLDTMQGGNLSFQVHPLTEFAREKFGLPYTQDESYYILDAEPGAVVYLGCKDDTDPAEMFAELEAAQRGETVFDVDRFTATFPARRHDHFLIPAGTLHCSGANSMVLEISATPYIFTFKLWDWNRMGLDGKPRPVNLARGREVILWHRNESYAREHLVNKLEPIDAGEGWREERTGLHPAEFIETRRHWFTDVVSHHTGGEAGGGVNMLNLVQGDAAIVESPNGDFEPFTVHFAETFIIPAAVGAYTLRPATPGTECATMKAFVRTRA
ncbi:MAG: class I mannose-6-phosphate isomerase [Kiritimatiellae bacterium]|jgi:mannose-6-phosphate isomerase class I|nr:class I mannose-6-phosphate isomerase [Kiritimatiellia bacterium]